MGAELLHNKFKDLNLVVTGVSSGIGYAVAKEYDSRGANVFGVDINKVKNSKKLSSRFSFYKCEVQNYNKMKEIIKKIIKKNKTIDILINCAGIIDFKSIENSSVHF